jgi:MFS family permease
MLEASRNLLLIYGIGAALGPTVAGFFIHQVGPGSLLLFLASTLLLLCTMGLYRLRVGPAIPAEEQIEFAPMTATSPVALEMDPRLDTATPEPPRCEIKR